MKVNFKKNETILFNVLSRNQIEEIVSTSYNILERVGVEVNDKEVMSLLKDAGCIIKDKTAYIPSFLVDECLATSPGKVSMSSRNGDLAMTLEKDRIYFGTGSDALSCLIHSRENDDNGSTKDIEDAARITDSLENLDFHMSLGLLSDVTDAMKYDRYQFACYA